jgi:hypothetical protein
MIYLLFFHAYINEMHGLRSKIPSKKSHQRCAKGFNSGVKRLMRTFATYFIHFKIQSIYFRMKITGRRLNI